MIKLIYSIVNNLFNKVNSKITSILFRIYVSFLAKIKDADISLGFVHIAGFPVIRIATGSTIKLGNNVVFVSKKYLNPIGLVRKMNIRTINKDSVLIIGNNVGFSGVTICCAESITIGDNVGVGANCIIIDTDFHNFYNTKNFIDKPESIPKKRVVIEDNVRIAMNVTILKGVTIGHDTVVAANTTVTKSCPPYSVLAGNPSRVIKKRDIMNI